MHPAQKLEKLFEFKQLAWGANLGGMSSRNVLFMADGTAYILKQYGQSARHQLAQLQSIILFLYQKNFTTPLPVRTSQGELHFCLGGTAYAVSLYVPGRMLHQEEIAPSVLQRTAQKLAQLHAFGTAANNSLNLPKRDPFDAQSARLNMETLLTCAQFRNLSTDQRQVLMDSVHLKRYLLQKTDIATLFPMNAHVDFVHGDFHNENILYGSNSSPICILDFEDSYLGHGVCDVMQFIQLNCCNTGFSPVNVQRGKCFAGAYSNAHGLHVEDLRLGLTHFFVAMASSLFFERGLLAEQTGLVTFLQRDIAKMKFYLANKNDLLAALSP